MLQCACSFILSIDTRVDAIASSLTERRNFGYRGHLYDERAAVQHELWNRYVQLQAGQSPIERSERSSTILTPVGEERPPRPRPLRAYKLARQGDHWRGVVQRAQGEAIVNAADTEGDEIFQGLTLACFRAVGRMNRAIQRVVTGLCHADALDLEHDGEEAGIRRVYVVASMCGLAFWFVFGPFGSGVGHLLELLLEVDELVFLEPEDPGRVATDGCAGDGHGSEGDP